MDEGVVDTERAADTIEFGSIIADKYTILRPDRGGSPDTFICRESAPSELRSIWAHRPRHRLDPHGERFRQELAKVAKLEHPQLRRPTDFGRDEASGIFYAVYPILELRNLADVLDQDWPLPEERVVWLVCQLLGALEGAHAAGLSHGDLRPHNVLVRGPGPAGETEELVLCGLGLANVARTAFSARPPRSRLPLATWMVGTAEYASPEQIRGEPHDARSDIYAAGLLLFQLLTRTQPFVANNDHDLAWMQCFTPPPPPSGYSRVAAALEAVCLKALTKTPDMRYQTANEMRAALLETQVTRSSRVSGRPSVRPSRASTAPADGTAEVVVAARMSDGPSLARVEAIDAELLRQSQSAARPDPAARSGRSPALLLVCSCLAVIAALIVPDLSSPDAPVDAPTLSELLGDEPSPIAPLADEGFEAAPRAVAVQAPSEPAAQAAAPGSAPAESAPEGDGTSMLTKAAAQLPAAMAAPTVPAKAPEAPAPAPAPKAAAPRPAVRVRTIEKSLVAAEASTTEVAVPESTTLAVSLQAAGESHAAPAPESPAAPEAAPSETIAPAAGHVAAAAQPEPQADVLPAPAATEPDVAPTLPPAAEPAVEPVAEADLPPKPIVLTNASPHAATAIPRAARVRVGEADVSHGAVSKAALRGALNEPALSRCYLDAVRSGEASGRSLDAILEIETNLAGRIVSAKLDGAGLPASLVRCVESSVRLGRVRGADTGELRASIDLQFEAQ